MEVWVGEVFFALFACELLLLEKSQHNPVNFLKALLFRTVRAFLVVVIDCKLPILLPPSGKAIIAIQIFALAALLRILHHVVADAAPEGLLEATARRHIRSELRRLTTDQVLLDLLL